MIDHGIPKPAKVAQKDLRVLRDSEETAGSIDWSPEFLELGYSGSDLERQEVDMREWKA